jgi:hypothetical protein
MCRRFRVCNTACLGPITRYCHLLLPWRSQGHWPAGHSRQCVGSTKTGSPVEVRTHPLCVRRQGNPSECTSPSSITLSSRSRSDGADAMGCHSIMSRLLPTAAVERVRPEPTGALRFIKGRSGADRAAAPTGYSEPQKIAASRDGSTATVALEMISMPSTARVPRGGPNLIDDAGALSDRSFAPGRLLQR